MAWYWIVLIVYVCLCVVISVLGVFLKPIGGIAKVLWPSWMYLIEFIYLILVWWWLASFKYAERKILPEYGSSNEKRRDPDGVKMVLF